MASIRLRRWLKEIGHLSEKQLILFLEGELLKRESTQVRSHLEGCWPCRLRAEEIEKAMRLLIQARARALGAFSLEVERSKIRFAAKLSRVAKESNSGTSLKIKNSIQRALTGLNPRLWKWALAALVLFAAIAITERVTDVEVVSARELLKGSSEYHLNSISSVPKAVVYQKLTVTKRVSPRSANAPVIEPAPVTWEIWNDIANSRVRQLATEADGSSSFSTIQRIDQDIPIPSSADSSAGVIQELVRDLSSNNLSWAQPLYADSFDGWLNSAGPFTEVVEKTEVNGADAWRIVTKPVRASEGGIEVASLVIRQSDQHPLEQYLRIGERESWREYQLTETVFEVINLDVFGTGFFLPPVKQAAPIISVPEPLVPGISGASEAEVHLRYQMFLHRCLVGLDFELLSDRQERTVVFRIDPESLKTSPGLLSALEHVPHLKMIVEPIKVADKYALYREGEEGEPSGEFLARVLPYLDSPNWSTLLKDGSRDRIMTDSEKYYQARRIAARARELSRKATLVTWQLRDLADRYPEPALAALGSESRRKLETVIRGYKDELFWHSLALESLLGEVLNNAFPNGHLRGSGQSPAQPSAVTPDFGEPAPPEWPHQIAPIYMTVNHINRLILLLFPSPALSAASESADPAGQRVRPVDNLVQDLLICFDQVRSEEPKLGQSFAGQFLGNQLVARKQVQGTTQEVPE